MNLTIEQMREIVAGAPEWALAWCPETDPSHPYTDASEGICGFCVEIKDLRAAIADHDTESCLHGYNVACLLCGFGTEDGKRVWRNNGISELQGGAKKRIQSAFEDDRTDFVSDIANHISPTTVVIER